MTRIALAVVALLLMAGCHRGDKATKLAALESAYRSGVFTTEEYDAKKAAIAGQPTAPAATVPVAAQPAIPAPQAEIPQAPTPEPPRSRPVKASPFTAAEAVQSAEPKSEPAPKAVCEDAESKAGKEKGVQERFFPKSIATVRKATEAALKNLDFNIDKDSGNDLEATRRHHIGRLIGVGGERLLLHFEKSQKDNRTGTLVTGETKKRFVGRIAQKSWTNATLAQIACQLAVR